MGSTTEQWWIDDWMTIYRTCNFVSFRFVFFFLVFFYFFRMRSSTTINYCLFIIYSSGLELYECVGCQLKLIVTCRASVIISICVPQHVFSFLLFAISIPFFFAVISHANQFVAINFQKCLFLGFAFFVFCFFFSAVNRRFFFDSISCIVYRVSFIYGVQYVLLVSNENVVATYRHLFIQSTQHGRHNTNTHASIV